MTHIGENIPEGDSRFPRWWLVIPFVGRAFLSALFLAGIIWVSILVMAHLGYQTAQVQCLARTLDIYLDARAPYKGREKAFRQQAEAAARIHVRRIGEGKENYCPPDNWGGKLEQARRWGLSSSKNWAQSERLVIIDQVARNAYAGRYAYPWPSQFECVNEYKATRLRNPLASRGRYVGSIDNMSLYCEQ